MRVVRTIAAASAVLFLAGCGAAEPQATATPVAAAKPGCTKTAATPAGQRPAVLAGTTGSWYGSGDLWVGLPDRAAGTSGGTIELKSPWVTLDGVKPSKDMGLPEVSAARAGASDAVRATFTDYARAFGTGDLAFWPSTLALPEAGCWTVTGRLKNTTIQFVVDVKAP
jgi:hypothetical protein